MISKALPYLRQLMGCLLLMLTASATAQTDSTRIRTSVNMVGFGTTNILDTYLSQEKFTGAGMTFLNITQKERPGKRWTTIMQQEANISFADDRAELTEEMEAAYSIYCGRYITLRLPGNWRLEAGGLLNGNIGIIYNTSNSNNPAQARLSLNVMPSAVVSKPFTLFRQQFAVRYELDLPLAGVMFSPNYGQSYYEIFNRGNYDHNIVPTTFISAPNMRQQLSIDWQAGRSWDLRVGYLGNYHQAEVNHLKQHIYNHRLMIGVVKRFRTIYYKR